METRKKIVYLIMMAILMGFPFQIFSYGYYGISIVTDYFYKLDYYKNFAYSEIGLSNGSTVKFGNYFEAFTSVMFGPFPWQLKHGRQLITLAETFSWYILFFFIARAVSKYYKKNKMFIVFLFFSIFVFAILAIYVNNFGIITRIRMPAFLALVCLAPFGIDLEGKFLKKINGFLESIWKFS